MNIQPVAIILTLIGSLVVAGILGWIRRPRLVVFVPRLFSHSKISDNGQIAEVSIMNRGFKTEEAIVLSLNPHLHYELVGSNNPESELIGSRLSIPRIGAADDCSVLLQIERGKFTYEDIVNCLSKETKAIVVTKLENIPVTAQQRVALTAFMLVLLFLATLLITSIDRAFEEEKSKIAETKNEPDPIAKQLDHQNWVVRDIYQQGSVYEKFLAKELTVTLVSVELKERFIRIQLIVSNKSNEIITLGLSASGSALQKNVPYGERVVSDKLMFPNTSSSHLLIVEVAKDDPNPGAIIEFSLEGESGDILRGRQLVFIR